MEIAWEGRPCGPKGCKGRKGLSLSSKHKWQSWTYLFTAPHPHFQRESLQTQISKLATFHLAKTHISELEIFVSPKPKYQSWNTFHPRPGLNVRRICFLHKPKLRSWKYSVVHKNQTSRVGCPPKTLISMCRFWNPKLQRWKHELSVQNTFFKGQPICCGCKAQISKLNIYRVWNI